MADFRHRIPENVPGKFYVDDQCIYCDLCRAVLPTVFREERRWGWASVFRQPSTTEEFKLAMEAVEACPTEAIGTDGDLHDWSIPPTRLITPQAIPQKTKKPWLLREHRVKLAAPVVLTALVIIWTFAVQSFTRYGDNWAVWPAILSVPLVAGIHIYLVTTLRPKWSLVGYAVVHNLVQVLVVTICIMRISKDSL